MRIKRVNVVTGPVSVFFSHPSNLSSQVFPVNLCEFFAFDIHYKRLASFS